MLHVKEVNVSCCSFKMPRPTARTLSFSPKPNVLNEYTERNEYFHWVHPLFTALRTNCKASRYLKQFHWHWGNVARPFQMINVCHTLAAHTRRTFTTYTSPSFPRRALFNSWMTQNSSWDEWEKRLRSLGISRSCSIWLLNYVLGGLVIKLLWGHVAVSNQTGYAMTGFWQENQRHVQQ